MTSWQSTDWLGTIFQGLVSQVLGGLVLLLLSWLAIKAWPKKPKVIWAYNEFIEGFQIIQVENVGRTAAREVQLYLPPNLTNIKLSRHIRSGTIFTSANVINDTSGTLDKREMDTLFKISNLEAHTIAVLQVNTKNSLRPLSVTCDGELAKECHFNFPLLRFRDGLLAFSRTEGQFYFALGLFFILGMIAIFTGPK